MKLLLGGPSYRMEVDARHAASLVPFAFAASMHGIGIIGTGYEHGTPVALARNGLFRAALETEATHLGWMDSDCAFPTECIDLIAKALGRWEVMTGAPCLLVPCPQRDRTLNIWKDARHKLGVLRTDGEIRPCYAGGFGCVFFDLRWYRENWPKAPWFRDGWDHVIGYLSEDYEHTRRLFAMGMTPHFVGAYVDHHDRGQGRPTAPPVEEVAP